MNIIVPALVLGFTAAFVVPFISGILRNVLPDSVAQFLPSSAVPSLGMQTLISITVFGLLLTFSLGAIRAIVAKR
jgi:hypothetical protein